MDMPDTDITAPMRGPAVSANPMGAAQAKAARMKKINPKGRKLDKNGNPIVTKEELEKSGMSLRDFLNKERGLTPRKDAPAKAADYTPLKQNYRQPSSSQAMDKPVGIKDDARRDKQGNFAGEAAAKSMAAEGGAGAAAAREARAAKEKDASKYTTGMMGGGKVKGYKVGGSPGMHRMPDGKMMKDSEHKGMMGGGKVKGYAPGGSIGKGYGKARGAKACKMR
jgi:hypothetical protein